MSWQAALLSELETENERLELLLERQFWMRNRSKTHIIRDEFTAFQGLSGQEWRAKFREIQRVNDSAHLLERRVTLNKRVGAVAKMQGGRFCILCGATAKLQVDHITPLSWGGDAQDPANLQVLCELCNKGKRDIRPGSVATYLGPFKNGLPPAARYKRLILSGQSSNGRVRGQCDCGRNVPEAVLSVQTRANFTPSLPTSIITCKECQ